MSLLVVDGIAFAVLYVALFGILRLLKPSMKAWQDFLDSLSTRGGNIFLLFSALFLILALYVHITHDARDSDLGPVAHDLLVGFGGALLGSLSSQSSKQQMQDRVTASIIKVLEPGAPPTEPEPTNGGK